MKRNTRGRHEGTIEQLPSGGFRARAPGGVDPVTGKRTRLSRTFASRPQAAQWLADQVSKRAKGQQITSGVETLNDWAKEWLAGKKDERERGTWLKYEQHLNKHILPFLGKYKLRDLTPQVVKKWLRDRGEAKVSASLRRKVCTTLTVCLNQAVREGRASVNPMRAVPRPKVDHRSKVEAYTAEQARRILQAAQTPKESALLRLSLDLGCRVGELLALHWDDINATARTVRIRASLEEVNGELVRKSPKTTASNRTVSISPSTAAAIEYHVPTGSRDPSQPVFCRPGGGYLTPSGYRAIWVRVVKAAGVPLKKLSIFRHTSAVLLLSAGVNVKVVSRRLGHTDIVITLRHYAAFLPEADEKAAEAMETIIGTGSGDPTA